MEQHHRAHYDAQRAGRTTPPPFLTEAHFVLQPAEANELINAPADARHVDGLRPPKHHTPATRRRQAGK